MSDAGFARVILERALSLEEIRAICTATPAEVECFVHGAICVGYSGRCFLSRSISARSGNRGACSQPCRQTWDLTDGRGRRYITGKHLLSVRDLNLSARIADLLDAGVTSFKIEGRLKDTGYIKNVVAYYRRAVDEALAARPQLRRASVGEILPDFTPDPSKSLRAANRRGSLTDGGPVSRRSIRRSRSASRWGMSGRCCAMGSGSTGFRTGRPRAKRAIRFGLRIRSLRATASVS